jgi:hypothetical protein
LLIMHIFNYWCFQANIRIEQITSVKNKINKYSK